MQAFEPLAPSDTKGDDGDDRGHNGNDNSANVAGDDVGQPIEGRGSCEGEGGESAAATSAVDVAVNTKAVAPAYAAESKDAAGPYSPPSSYPPVGGGPCIFEECTVLTDPGRLIEEMRATGYVRVRMSSTQTPVALYEAGAAFFASPSARKNRWRVDPWADPDESTGFRSATTREFYEMHPLWQTEHQNPTENQGIPGPPELRRLGAWCKSCVDMTLALISAIEAGPRRYPRLSEAMAGGVGDARAGGAGGGCGNIGVDVDIGGSGRAHVSGGAGGAGGTTESREVDGARAGAGSNSGRNVDGGGRGGDAIEAHMLWNTSMLRLYRYRTFRPLCWLPMRLGYVSHTDLGLLTVTPRGTRSGLEIRIPCASRGRSMRPKFKWVQIEKQMGADEVLIFPGDSLEMLTEGAYRPLVHRVVNWSHATRMSAPFFLRAAKGTPTHDFVRRRRSDRKRGKLFV